MEILNRGTPPEDRAVVFDCRNCKSQLKATTKDGRVHHDQRDGNACIFQCPVCGNEIWVALSKFNN